jgi:thiamine-monophosphate kinase
MRPGTLAESDAIRLLANVLRAPLRSGVRLGIGDDAALVDAKDGLLVWTVDACLEGSHFDRRWLELGDVAWKAFHAAVSDLAAMGARPIAALSALELPRGFSKRELEAFVHGQSRAARSLACPIAGGNIARGRKLGVTTSVLGVAKRPILRDGARPGDELWLIGNVGLAAAGLALVRSKRSFEEPAARRAIAAWRRPRALVREGLRLSGRASASIDISDGLGGDARHLAEASGVRIVIEEEALLAALPRELVRLASLVGRSPLELALSGGEDYALVATGPRAKRPRGASRIGRVTKGRGASLERQDGTSRTLARGYDHLAR